MAIALNTVIVDGQEYKPGDVIPDFKSIKCVDTREPRKYQGLSADVSVLNDVIAKYASGGASCFMSDTGEYYEYDRKEKTWKLITNITERGFDAEKAYGALKHMLKNVTVSDREDTKCCHGLSEGKPSPSRSHHRTGTADRAEQDRRCFTERGNWFAKGRFRKLGERYSGGNYYSRYDWLCC